MAAKRGKRSSTCTFTRSSGVHFHIIPRVAGDGLKFKWSPTELTEDNAQDLLAKMHEALADES